MGASWITRLAVPALFAVAVGLVADPAVAAKTGGGRRPAPPPSNLVTNGSFESGTYGWKVEGPGTAVVVASAPSLDPGVGKFLLVTGRSGATVSQTVPTVVGKVYRVGWSSTGGDDPGTATMGAGPVLVGPRTVVGFQQIYSDSCPTTHWYSYSQPVRAAGSTLTVTFGYTGATPWGLDEVSVTLAR